MKKVSLFVVLAGVVLSAQAVMVYDPATCIMYSSPIKGINAAQYYLYVAACVQIEANMQAVNPGKKINAKKWKAQCIHYLQKIGNPTARRLIEDLKENAIYYSNGQFMRKIY